MSELKTEKVSRDVARKELGQEFPRPEIVRSEASTRNVRPDARSSAPETWAVVGGGLLGLTLAYRLAAKGRSVTLFEAAKSLDGVVGVTCTDGRMVRADRYAGLILRTDRNIKRLSEDINAHGSIAWTRPEIGLRQDGYALRAGHLADHLGWPGLGTLQRMRLAVTAQFAARAHDRRRLDQLKASDWLGRMSGDELYAKAWRPLLAASLGPLADEASASYAVDMARRFLHARPDSPTGHEFGTLRDGETGLVRQLAARIRGLGGLIRTGTAVTGIARENDGVSITTRAGTERFDHVVSTLACPKVARLCPDLATHERERFAATQYLGTVILTAVTNRPGGLPLITLTDDPAISALIDRSALIGERAQIGSGTHQLHLVNHAPSDDAIFAKPDAALIADLMPRLVASVPGIARNDVIGAAITRRRHARPIPLAGPTSKPRMLTSVPGLYVVNAAHLGHGMTWLDDVVGLADRTMPVLLAHEPAMHIGSVSLAA